MEKWQKELIKQNLPELISSTSCNVELLARLRSKDVLSGDEVERINVKENQSSQDSAHLLYKILKSKQNSYDILVEALIETKQTGAASILQKISTAELAKLHVNFLNSVFQVECLDAEQIKSVQKWLQANLSENECQKIIAREFSLDAPLELIRNTITPPNPLYVPRFVTRRLKINPSLFYLECSDIFAFTGVTHREELRNFVSSNFAIGKSIEQLRNREINCRFILLDKRSDWKGVCEIATAPVHLIRFECATQEFVLEATSRRTCVLDKHLTNQEQHASIFLSEDEFLEAALAQEEKGVCICDSPGMGKSLLFANLARKMSLKNPDRVVALVKLRELKFSESEGFDVSKVLDLICTSTLAHRLLVEILKKEPRRFELFLDGLDEVPADNLRNVLLNIQKVFEKIPQVRIYITSRPVARHELEQTVDAISYDIIPFDDDVQINFLVSSWLEKEVDKDKDILARYARATLKMIQKSSNAEERKITGIPLLCKLIAEVYSDSVEFRTFQTSQEESYPITYNLVHIYEKYVQHQLGQMSCDLGDANSFCCSNSKCKSESCLIRNFHVWHALVYIFPKLQNTLFPLNKIFDNLTENQKLGAALLVHSNGNGLEFAHRTFAEFLVAKYLKDPSFKRVLAGSKQLVRKVNEHVFHLLSTSRETVITYFLNSLLINPCANPNNIIHVELSLPKKIFNAMVLYCLRQDYVWLLEMLLATKTNSPGLLRFLHPKIRRVDKKFAEKIIYAINDYKCLSMKRIIQFYENFYHVDFFSLISKELLACLLMDFARRGNYPGAEMLIDKVNPLLLLNRDFLYNCLFGSRHDNRELIDKKLDVIKLFIKYKAFIDEGWPGGKNSLLNAFIHISAVKFLVDNGANILATDSQNKSIFYYTAIKQTKLNFLQLFVLYLTRFDSVKIEKKLWEENCNEELLRSIVLSYLIDRSDLFKKHDDPVLIQLFYVAVIYGDVLMTDVLLNHDATLLSTKYEKNLPPIFLAVRSKNVEMFKNILQRGVNLFITGADNRTLLHEAAMTHDMQMFSCVVETLKATTPNESEPRTLEDLVIWKMASCLSTPLHILCKSSMPVEALDKLLNCRASELSGFINLENSSGETPLMVGVNKGIELNFIKQLISFGATWDIKNSLGCNVTHICGYRGDIDCFNYFVELGCNVNELDSRGNNALQCTILNLLSYVPNPNQVLENCLGAGVDIKNVNKTGQTGYEMLKKERYSEKILQLLEPTKTPQKPGLQDLYTRYMDKR